MENGVKEISFEQAMQELEQLVGKMESGGLSLDQLVKGFERGRQLADYCRRQLDHFERKISVLSRDDGAQGEWQDFKDGDAAAPPGSARAAAPAVPENEDLPF